MRKLILAPGVAAVLAVLACHEPGPAEPPAPTWYWHTGPTGSDLTDVASAGRDDVWLVGVNAAGDGEAYHYNGFSWSWPPLPPVDVGPLYAVAMFSTSGDAWAAGGGGYFFYWDGNVWQDWPHPAPGRTVYGMAFASDALGWAVGEGGLILKFDGTGWEKVEPSPTTRTLRRVRALSETAAWAVGDGGTVLRYDGSSWRAVEFPATADLADLCFPAEDDGWVVGKTAAIYRWDGAGFTRYDSPDAEINYLCCGFATPAKGWAGGDRMHLARYDAGAWRLEENLPSGHWELSAIHFVDSDEGWAVGPDGAMLHYH